MVAGISLGGQVGEGIRQAQLIRLHWQLANLKRQLLGRRRPYVIRQGAKTAHRLQDWLFLVAPNDLLLLCGNITGRSQDRRYCNNTKAGSNTGRLGNVQPEDVDPR
jgi:hypothetical protein